MIQWIKARSDCQNGNLNKSTIDRIGKICCFRVDVG